MGEVKIRRTNYNILLFIPVTSCLSAEENIFHTQWIITLTFNAENVKRVTHSLILVFDFCGCNGWW